MAREIERKFLVDREKLKEVLIIVPPFDYYSNIKQGYLTIKPAVRIRTQGQSGFITVKGNREGISCDEFEYQIPLSDAQSMLKLCTNVIEKTRMYKEVGAHTWEIDIFEGENSGLIVAEIELESEDENFTLPDWVTEEVTNQSNYYNCNLVSHPYSKWSQEQK